MSWAMCHLRRSVPSCFSRCSASAMSMALLSSPATCHSMNGPLYLDRSGSPAPWLDRLTHHVHILEMNGESYRLATSKKAQRRSVQERNQNPKTPNEGKPTTKK